MLTSELVRVRREGEYIVPRYIRRQDRPRLLALGEALIGALGEKLGERREEVSLALAAVPHGPRDRLVVQGLTKLLFDRCELVASEGIDPASVRDAVFRVAAERRRALGPTERFDRAAVVAAAADRLGVAPAAVGERLFADLRKNERLAAFRAPSAEELLQRYDVALAQGVLMRAVRVEVALLGEAPDRVRQLFRAARFYGLLHRVRAEGGGYRIELDGPLSLFSSVQRYGLSLALFLPAVLRCKSWRLRAALSWGKERAPAWFELGPDAGLVPHGRRADGVAPDLASFAEAFRALGSAWSVAPSEEIVALPGEPAVVPDLVFDNGATGERVYLEAFGYWSRQAVWQRIETVRRGFPGRIILAAGKQLRVSEEALDEGEAGELYIYRTTIQPKAVLARLDRR